MSGAALAQVIRMPVSKLRVKFRSARRTVTQRHHPTIQRIHKTLLTPQAQFHDGVVVVPTLTRMLMSMSLSSCKPGSQSESTVSSPVSVARVEYLMVPGADTWNLKVFVSVAQPRRWHELETRRAERARDTRSASHRESSMRCCHSTESHERADQASSGPLEARDMSCDV